MTVTSDKPTVDWELAKSLFLKGLPDKETCATVGATLSQLYARVTRYHWRALRKQSNILAKQTGIDLNLTPAQRTGRQLRAVASGKAMGQRSEVSREIVADVGQKLATALQERNTPKSLDGLQQTAEVLQTVTKTLEIAHGWSNTGVNAIIVAGTASSFLDRVDAGEVQGQITGTSEPHIDI